jgi:hypothetical protein
MKKIILNILFLTIGISLYAQDNWNEPTEGELEDSQIVIEKNRSLDLPRATRSFRQVPKIDQSSDSIRVNFSWNEITPELSKLKPGLRVLRIKDEPIPKLFANQVSAGFGNYGASYLSGFVGNKRDRNKSYGVQFYHKSFNKGAVDEKYSGSGYQMVRPSARFFNDKISFETSLLYDRTNNYAYGSIEEELDLNESFSRDEFQKKFQTAGAHIGLSDRNIEDYFTYDYDADFYHLFTSMNTAETNFNFSLNNTYNFRGAFGAKLNASGFISNYNYFNESQSYNRNLIQIDPSVVYKLDQIILEGGLNISYDNQSRTNISEVYVYPNLNATYFPLAKTYLGIGISGDVRQVTYKSVLETNPYLDPSFILENTINPFQLTLKAGSNLLDKVQIDGSFEVGTVNKLPYFTDVRTDNQSGNELLQSFVSIYSDNLTELKSSILIQTDFGKNFNLSAKGQYLSYANDSIDALPYVPKFKLDLKGNVSIKDKVEIGLSVYLQSKMEAYYRRIDFSSNLATMTEIDPFADLGLDVRYNLTSRASIFVNANNLLSNKYEYYLNYPNRGFQILGGFTYSF